jgi:hypothetical protein
MSKLAETVDLLREALLLRPRGNPGRASSLLNLSRSYLAEFERNGDESTLIKILKLQRECLNLWPPGNPHRCDAHYVIARVQLLNSSLFDWAGALNHLMQAMSDNNAPSKNRLVHGIRSLRLVEQTSSRNIVQYFYSQLDLDVYIQAIQLLPRVAHAGMNLSARLRELSGSEQLCRAAAMRAMLLNQLPTAVEVFEEGKTVFWPQALRLRSTALDELPNTDGKRLRHLFSSLDADYVNSPMDGEHKANLERHIESRRQLNEQADRLIEEIRTRPGFERFLRVLQYAKLAQSAANGFVVTLVANEPDCFAIIIQAHEDPKPVLLPSATIVTP